MAGGSGTHSPRGRSRLFSCAFRPMRCGRRSRSRLRRILRGFAVPSSPSRPRPSPCFLAVARA